MVKHSKSVYIIGSIIIGIVTVLGILAGLIFGGVLDSTPKKLVFTTASIEKTYNGKVHTSDEWELVSGELKNGHEAVVTITGEQTAVGSSENTFDVSIIDSRGADVTRDYEIVKDPGTITVIERRVEVIAGSFEKTYDAQTLTVHEYEVLVGSFVDGHVVTANYIGEITDVGECDNVVSFTIEDEDGNDVTSNYYFIYNNGTLKINPIKITVQSGDVTGEYNAQPLKSANDNFTIVEGEDDIVEGHQVVINFFTSQTDVGSCENEFTYKVMNGEEDLTKNYEVETFFGTITVNGKEIVVYCNSDEKVYDATKLSNSKISSGDLTYDELLDKWTITDTGEEFTYQSVGSIVNVGTGENSLIYDIINSDGISVNGNYIVEVVNGTLTVTPRYITVESNSDKKVYDGRALTKDGIKSSDVVYDELQEKWIITATGEEFTYQNTGTITDVGMSKNTTTYDIKNTQGLSAISNYIVTVMEGELTVTPRLLTVASSSDDKVYDGTPLRKDGISSIDLTFDDLSGKWIITATGEEFIYQNVGERTIAGTSDNTITYTVKKADGTDSRSNYEVTLIPGELTVTPRPILIVTGDGTLQYNGLAQEYRRYSQPENLVEGHTLDDLSIVFIKHTEASTYKNEIDLSLVKVLDESGKDVTNNYKINTSFGNLKIEPKIVLITTETATKKYDGEVLTCHEYTVSTEFSFVSGHQETLVFTGNQTGVGSSKNTAFVSMILDENNNEISRNNYEIRFSEGDLIVYGSLGSTGGNDTGEEGEEGENGETPDPYGDGDQTPVPMYKVTTAKGGLMYLKQYAFGNYEKGVDGNYEWIAAPIYKNATVNPQHFVYAGLAKNQQAYSAQIIRLSEDVPYAIPYYTDLSTEDMKNDVYITKSKLEYEVSYIPYNLSYPYGINVSGTAYFSQEDDYSEYVYKTYLSLPTNTKKVLEGVIATFGLDASDPYVIEKVAKVVSEHVEYDASTKRYGGDEVEYFFLNAQKGKCTHYATAGTALFRALGIPARYVLGMAANIPADKEYIVKSPGHAWVEVYCDGLGWIPVEVTGTSSGGGQQTPEDDAITIKPYDVFVDYTVPGAPLSITYDNSTKKNELQGVDFNRLVKENGYTYTFVVEGRQSGLGLSYTEIKNFVLLDKDKNDITSNYKFTFQKGTLQIYLKELSVQTPTLAPIDYDGLEHTVEATPDNYFVDGSYLEGHFLKEISFKVKAKDAGKYAVVIDKFVISDGDGNDVTGYYKINRTYGYLTILRREQVVQAGSISITIDQLFDEYGGTLTYTKQVFTNEIGHKITITCRGELSGIGSADNEVIEVMITDEKGKDVTKNYKIDTQMGELVVTP